MSEIVMMNDGGVQEPLSVRTPANIRWLIRRDWPEVSAIEGASFQEPWDKEKFHSLLNERNIVGMIAEVSNKVVGFFIYELHKQHLNLLIMAVHPAYRRQGIGDQMMGRLISKLSPGRRTELVVLLPESCAKATRPFFEKYGELGTKIRLTEVRGMVTYSPIFSAMTARDVKDVQSMENAFASHYGKKARDIGAMLENDTRYGIVARDKLKVTCLASLFMCGDSAALTSMESLASLSNRGVVGKVSAGN